MITFSQEALEALADAVVVERKGRIYWMSRGARGLLPRMEPGQALPQSLETAAGAGWVELWGERYALRALEDEGESEERVLLLDREAVHLTQEQLEAVSFVLRRELGVLDADLQLMARSLAQDPQARDRLSAMTREVYRMVRLVNNLDFLRQDGTGQTLRPATLDLAGLVRRRCTEAAGLLAEAGVELECDTPPSLLLTGDESLLERLLLGLISNAAKGKGHVSVRLRRQGDRAVLTVTGGALEEGSQLPRLLSGQGSSGVPQPDQGGLLGLSVARRIVALHQGGLLARETQEGEMEITISLPMGRGGSVQVRTPRWETDGGYPPLLLELSDVLPNALFCPEDLEE